MVRAARMEVEYLRKLGLRIPSGSDAGPVVLQQRGFTANVSVAAAPSQNGSSKPAAAGKAAAAGKVAAVASKAVKQGGPITTTVPANDSKAPLCKPCGGPMAGYMQEPLKREGHPLWYQPSEGVDLGLRTYNSLTGEKELFKPLDGKKIRWYTCGPTVYDVSHMGHARAYLTFDILRRIMMNYFKYDIKYQINITDIDDKIILRSRQNKLFSDFEKEAAGMSGSALQEVVDTAVSGAETKLLAKKPEPPEGKATEKDKQEYEKLLAEHGLKVGQFQELKDKVAAAKGKPKELLAAARDPLMAKLDKERGHTVTDHAIFNAHARKFEDTYLEDMDNLGVLRADVVTRISDFMDGRVQKFIEQLEDDGMSYASAGSVYFDIDAFNRKGFTYRKLVPAACCSAAEMEEGEGALAATDGDKRNPNDFALWKKSKPGEPAWESRWGPGRPGWHIECSVMATSVMKEYLDIHGGGEDLKFPHHDNEIAQSEAYLGRQQWCNYFWHAGHLSIAGLKMSKSLKNFITIRQALEINTGRQMRLMFLMQQWDRGMNYSDDAIAMAKAEERKLKHFIGCLKFFTRHDHSKSPAGDREKSLMRMLADCKQAVDEALKDNFNTSKAVARMSELVGLCYGSYDALPEACLEPVEKVRDFVVEIMGIFGVENLSTTPDKEADWTKALDAFAKLREDVRQAAREKAIDKVSALVKAAVPHIAAAKSAGLGPLSDALKRFTDDLAGCKTPQDLLKRCDEVRDKDFVQLGVRLEDRGTSGFVWMFEDTKTMVREAQEAEEKKAEAQAEKLQRSLAEKKKALTGAEKNAVKPADLFKTGGNKGLYSAYDENGLPTKLASGEEPSKAKQKDFKKDLAKQEKEFEKLQKQAGELGIEGYLAKMRKEVSDMEAQLTKR